MDDLFKMIQEAQEKAVDDLTPDDLQAYMDFFEIDRDQLMEKLTERADQMAMTIAVASALMEVEPEVVIQTIILDAWIDSHKETLEKIEENDAVTGGGEAARWREKWGAPMDEASSPVPVDATPDEESDE